MPNPFFCISPKQPGLLLMSTVRTEGEVSTLPITGGRLMDFPDDPIACMRELHAEHGDLAALEEDGQRIVFAFGSQWNQRVLTDEKSFISRFFSLRGSRNSAQRRLTSGLLSMNGVEHKANRRMVMEPFQKKVIASYFDNICSLTSQMLDDWRVGQVRNIHEDMTQYMLRVTSSILFGFDVPELSIRIGEMIDHWVHLNHQTGMGALRTDANLSDGYERLLEHAEELEAAIRQMIDLRRSDCEQSTDVLSLLIRANEQDGGILSDEKLIGNVALLFGAAHLTTANTLTWTLFLLAQHPSIMRELHQEISSEVSGALPTVAEARQLPLMERVVKESMRVLPASGYLHRNVADSAQLGPLELSRGTPVVFSQYITHHMPELYPDPDTFQPDRWLTISPSPYAYLPFGAGPRMCIGAPMAMMILNTALPAILKRYRLSVVPGSEISGRIVSSMLGPVTDVPMAISPADGQFHAVPVTGNIQSLVNLPEVPASHAVETRRAA
jgi:cytochrome P450